MTNFLYFDYFGFADQSGWQWAQAVVEETTCASADLTGRAVVGLEEHDHYDASLCAASSGLILRRTARSTIKG